MTNSNKNPGIGWTSIVLYVDIDTGEIITKKNIKEYIIIKTTKHVKRSTNGNRIEYTKQCRKSTQTKLDFK